MRVDKLVKVIVSTLVLIMIAATSAYTTHKAYENYIEYKDNQIDSLQQVNDSLMEVLKVEVSEYISKVAPDSKLDGGLLIEKCLEYRIDPVLVLSQGHLESHFGTKGISAKTNNPWNTYAYDNYSYGNISKQGKYSHPNEGIDPYLSLLKNRYLNGKTEQDLLRDFRDYLGRRYASNPNYESQLKSIYNRIVRSTSINHNYYLLLNNLGGTI